MDVRVNIRRIPLDVHGTDPWNSVWDVGRKVWVSSSPCLHITSEEEELDSDTDLHRDEDELNDIDHNAEVAVDSWRHVSTGDWSPVPDAFYGYTCFPSPQSSCWNEQEHNSVSDDKDDQTCPYLVVSSSPSSAEREISVGGKDKKSNVFQFSESEDEFEQSNTPNTRKSSRTVRTPGHLRDFEISSTELLNVEEEQSESCVVNSVSEAVGNNNEEIQDMGEITSSSVVETSSVRKDNLNERQTLEGRVSPDVPEPYSPSVEEELDGWMHIDKVGGWRALISKFGSMDQIPKQYDAIWAWSMGEIFTKINEAEEGKDLDRALMWLLFLPQALCRKPRKGGSQGRGFINKRFNALTERKWGELVRLWEDDMAWEEDKRSKRRPKVVDNRGEKQEAEDEKKKQQVLKLLSKGQIHRAVNRIKSFGVADISDPRVREQMEAKHPPRWKDLQDTVEKGSPVENLKGLRDALLSLKRGGSPGSGGMRAEYLITLAETLEGEKMALLEQFGLRYLKGELPKWFYAVFLSSQAVPLYKTIDGSALRPIGIKHQLL